MVLLLLVVGIYICTFNVYVFMWKNRVEKRQFFRTLLNAENHYNSYVQHKAV